MKKIIIIVGIIIFLLASGVSAFFILNNSGNSLKETGFIVSINGEQVTSTTVLEVDYSPINQNDWKSKVSAQSVYSDGSLVDLKSSDYTFENVPAVLNANEDGYLISVKYKSYTAYSFKLVVNRLKVSRPTKNDDVDYVYNGSNYLITNINNDLLNEAYYVDETSDNYIQKNAGVYTTKFVLNPNYVWAKEFAGSRTEPQVLQWSIKKQEIDLPSILDKVYTGENIPPQLSVIGQYKISANQNYSEYVEVGTYSIKVELLDKVNYKWRNGTSDDIIVEYKIVES